MDATTQQVADAYALVDAVESQAVADISTLASEFEARMAAILATLPGAAQSSGARQFALRVNAAVAGVFGYDLSNMRGTYGLNNAANAE